MTTEKLSRLGLIALAAIPLFGGQNLNAASRPGGMVGWWPGDGYPQDLAGSNHGILAEGTSFEPDISVQAFRCDGLDDNVIPAGDELTELRDNFTFADQRHNIAPEPSSDDGPTNVGVTSPPAHLAAYVPQVLRVHRSATGRTHDGLSWDTAFLTVSDGLNAARSGDEVWVALGTYIERITLKDGVGLYGGFAGMETHRNQRDWEANPTILDGAGAGTVVAAPAAVGESACIDGFTIRNGKADYGAGILCDHSSPTIANNRILSNFSTERGGGIVCEYASPKIVHNRIEQNEAKTGGGISCHHSSSPLISSNSIYANRNAGGHGAGGGIQCGHDSSPTVVNNRIIGNQVLGYLGSGGGIYVDSWSPAASRPLIANNLIVSNTASVRGGGILCVNAAFPQIVNNTIVGNSSPESGGVGNKDWGEPGSPAPLIANNIVAFNSSGIVRNGGTMSVTHNCVFGNGSVNYLEVSPGTGDIASDPLFADSAASDFHLARGSPCIDAGSDEAARGLGPDLDGEPRPQGLQVDIGADEFSTVVRSPRRSGEILAGDGLRFAADGSALFWLGEIRFAWDFGDGRSSAQEVPGIVSFSQPGLRVVSLNVSNEMGNNLAFPQVRTITVQPATNPAPDLAVNELNIPGNISIAQPTPILYTVSNLGDGTVLNRTWKDALYLSRDPYLDVNDRLLVSATVSKVVPVGSGYTQCRLGIQA